MEDGALPDVVAEGRRVLRHADDHQDIDFATSKAEGEPLLATGSTGQLVPHPLVTMLREHDVLVDRLAAAARVRHHGPEPSAVLKPSIGKSPAAKLTAA